MAHKEMVYAWLKDAYSMEMGLVPILENHAKDAKDFPQVQARDEQHIQETKQHAERLKTLIEARGEHVSGIKTAIGGLVGTVQSVATGPFHDEVVKNALSDFAAENFEIASYKALIAAAQEIGDQEIVRVCQQNLMEDEAMAKWLDQNMPTVIHAYLQQKVAEHSH